MVGDNSLDEKIRKLDAQLMQHRENIRKTRPGPAQEAAKRRALGVCMHPAPASHVMQRRKHSRKSRLFAVAFIMHYTSMCIRSYSTHLRRMLAAPPLQEVRNCAYACVQVMKQKKLYEQQRDQLYGQQFNVEQTAFVVQSARDTAHTVTAMQAASKEMTRAFKSKELNIDNIDRLQDSLADIHVRALVGTK